LALSGTLLAAAAFAGNAEGLQLLLEAGQYRLALHRLHASAANGVLDWH